MLINNIELILLFIKVISYFTVCFAIVFGFLLAAVF